MYYTWLKRFAREFGKSLINSAWKCVTAFCLCRTFWERVKVQVMEGSHVRKKYFGHWLINPYPPLTALLSKGSLFTDLATCRDLHWVVEIPLREAPPKRCKGRGQRQKNVFFRALPELPNPPPPMTPIRATWSSFFGRQNSMLCRSLQVARSVNRDPFDNSAVNGG